MGRKAAAAIIGLLMATGSVAMAETWSDERGPDPATPMGRYLYSPAFLERMYEGAIASDRTLGLACPGGYTIKPFRVAVVRPIELPDGAMQATLGTWLYRYDAVRCGASKRYNLMMTAQPKGPLRSMMLFPGDTIASVTLMKDAIMSVWLQAKLTLGMECKDIQVFDTAVTQMPGPLTENGQTIEGIWKENWTLQGCGKQAVVPVTFIPNGKGGTVFAAGK